MSSGSGQLRPAARKRFRVARTVEGATPTRRAISWFDKSPTNFNRRTSRTWRIVVLSAGIRYLPWTAKGADLSRPAEAPTTRAKSSRNGGRDHLGMVGGIISEWRATSFRNHGRHRPESAQKAGREPGKSVEDLIRRRGRQETATLQLPETRQIEM